MVHVIHSFQDWVNDTMDVKGKGRAGVRRLSATAVAAAERSKRDAELRALFVTVPPGDEAKLIACPICKETLKSEFIEDDEDWVWKNAVIKDGRVSNHRQSWGPLLTYVLGISCYLSCRDVQ